MNKEQVEYALADTAAKATVGACRGIGKIANNRIMQKVVRGAGEFLLGAAVAAVAMGKTVYADVNGEQAITDMIEPIYGIVTKIGGVVMVFGGITAGIGIANQDDAGRNRGSMTMA